jgi:hypothetical protein
MSEWVRKYGDAVVILTEDRARVILGALDVCEWESMDGQPPSMDQQGHQRLEKVAREMVAEILQVYPALASDYYLPGKLKG